MEEPGEAVCSEHEGCPEELVDAGPRYGVEGAVVQQRGGSAIDENCHSLLWPHFAS